METFYFLLHFEMFKYIKNEYFCEFDTRAKINGLIFIVLLLNNFQTDKNK